jgi:hypothetical protein
MVGYSLDPAKNSKQIDMTIMERLGEGAQFKGLYKLDNDTLEVCYYLDPDHFRCFVEGPMTPELEVQLSILVREYKTDAELLSPHAREGRGAHEGACTMYALSYLGAAQGEFTEIGFL